MTTIAVLGNCQADVLSDCLTVLVPGATVETWPIYTPVAGAALGEERRAGLERADVILTQLVDDRVRDGDIPRMEDLARAGRRVFTWPVIAFKGFQPDCTYVFQNGQPLQGMMGPYHSAIAVGAYMEGLDERRARGLFNALTYGALGYFDEFETGAEVLTRSADRSGLDVSGFFTAPRACFTHTFNHPGVGILHALAIQLLRRAGIDPVDVDTLPVDRLAAGYVWPVYPEIATRLGVEGGLTFGANGHRADHDAVTSSTFQALAAHERDHGPIALDPDRPMATPVIERARAFVRDHVIR